MGNENDKKKQEPDGGTRMNPTTKWISNKPILQFSKYWTVPIALHTIDDFQSTDAKNVYLEALELKMKWEKKQ